MRSHRTVRVGPGDRLRRYADEVPRLKDHYDEADLARILDGAGPSTPDEVSITKDGQRLDSAAAVIAFFEGLRDQRTTS